MGWGDIFTILNKVIPGREERIRNQIDDIKKKMDELVKESPSAYNIVEYQRLTDKLYELEKRLKNR